MTDATEKGMGAYVHVDETGRAQPVTDKHATEWINAMLKEDRRRELPSAEELLAAALMELRDIRKHLERQEKREIEILRDVKKDVKKDLNEITEEVSKPVMPHPDLLRQLEKAGLHLHILPGFPQDTRRTAR